MASAHVLMAVVATKQFANVGMEVLSSVIHLCGVSILSYMLAMKFRVSEFSFFGLTHITWPRLLVILNFLDSWAFLFTTGILVHGTGMELNDVVCLLGILNCIIFYTTSKIVIYLFLAEKVYVVWDGRRRRFHSKVYLACLAVIAAYVGVIVFLLIDRISFFRGDGACVIGLTRAASLTLLIYDLLINVLLTSLFVYPLLGRTLSSSLRGVAMRTLWAAAVALTTSCINILVLTIMHGQQLAWVCLASCGSDVVVNAVVLCWVTSNKHEAGTEPSDDPSSHGANADPSKGFTSNIVLYSATTSEFPHPSDSPRTPGSRGRLPRIFEARSRASRTKSMGGGKGLNPYSPTRSQHRDVELIRVGKYDTGSGKDTASYGLTEEEDVDGDIEAEADSPRGEDVIVSPSRPVPPIIRAPRRTHSSTTKRSNMLLNRHGASVNELQIMVTRETETITDNLDDALPLAKSPSPPSA